MIATVMIFSKIIIHDNHNVNRKSLVSASRNGSGREKEVNKCHCKKGARAKVHW